MGNLPARTLPIRRNRCGHFWPICQVNLKPVARVQTGVGYYSEDEQWHVVQRVTVPGKPARVDMFEQGYATEAEAEAAARAVMAAVRARAAEAGLPVFPTAETN